MLPFEFGSGRHPSVVGMERAQDECWPSHACSGFAFRKKDHVESLAQGPAVVLYDRALCRRSRVVDQQRIPILGLSQIRTRPERAATGLPRVGTWTSAFIPQPLLPSSSACKSFNGLDPAELLQLADAGDGQQNFLHPHAAKPRMD